MSELHVVFRVGEAEYVIPATAVLQMESFTGATEVPGVVPWVAGVVQVRGRVIPIIDLRARFGLPRVSPTIESRFLVVRRGARTLGLLVDSARDVVRIESSSFHPPPDVLAQQTHGFVREVAQAGPRTVLRIDLDRVIGTDALT